MKTESLHAMLGLTRIALGLIFLWAFFDKVFGLGFATTADKAWLAGGSPTAGFLLKGTRGPFAGMFQSLAGSGFVEWLFMIGLLGVGIALTLGIAMRLAVYSGVTLLALMWLAALPPAHHPFLDEHVVYSLFLFVLLQTNAEEHLGLGTWWKGLAMVKMAGFLR